jgi:hypothetical protein
VFHNENKRRTRMLLLIRRVVFTTMRCFLVRQFLFVCCMFVCVFVDVFVYASPVVCLE